MPFRVKAGALPLPPLSLRCSRPRRLAIAGVSTLPSRSRESSSRAACYPRRASSPATARFSRTLGRQARARHRFHIPSMKCATFWSFIGTVKGFGETAFATESGGKQVGQGDRGGDLRAVRLPVRE